MAAEGWFWRWGWGRRCPGRPGLPGPGPGPTTPLLLFLLLGPVVADITDGNSEHLKREHSLIKPYQGVGSSSMPLWDFQGSTILTSQYVRLTPDERSKEGSIWNHQPCFLKDWEMHVHFKVHGAGKKNLHGDGIALWYTRDRLVPGPVFGSKDNFHGLAIFLDTYPNDETTERVFPYISVMVNNGSLSYDHSKDGRWTELAGCTADFRNRDHDTFLAVRYSRGRLTVMTDLEDKNEWKNCIDITGVRLPTGYYFGASAGTGDLSDNHDIISMKLFQLMVEHTPDEENIDWTKIEPSVNFLKSPKEAEHGYASLCPHRSPGPVNKRRKRSPQASGTLDSGRSVHNELEKRRRAQLKRCLEELKQQMPLGADCARYTTLSLLRWARMHIQKLEEQEQQARRLKEKLRSKQQSLQQQLEQLRGLAGPGERERPRADSLDSSGLSSERSDSDQEEAEVDVESLVFGGEAELLRGFGAGQEHSYSHSRTTWL